MSCVHAVFLLIIHHCLCFNLGALLLTVQYTENSLHNLLKCQSKSVPFKIVLLKPQQTDLTILCDLVLMS